MLQTGWAGGTDEGRKAGWQAPLILGLGGSDCKTSRVYFLIH